MGSREDLDYRGCVELMMVLWGRGKGSLAADEDRLARSGLVWLLKTQVVVLRKVFTTEYGCQVALPFAKLIALLSRWELVGKAAGWLVPCSGCLNGLRGLLDKPRHACK